MSARVLQMLILLLFSLHVVLVPFFCLFFFVIDLVLLSTKRAVGGHVKQDRVLYRVA